MKQEAEKARKRGVSVTAPALLFKWKRSIICFSHTFFFGLFYTFSEIFHLVIISRSDKREWEKKEVSKESRQQQSSLDLPLGPGSGIGRFSYGQKGKKKKAFSCLCIAMGIPRGKPVQGSSGKSVRWSGFWFCLLNQALLCNEEGQKCAAHTPSRSSPPLACTVE